MNKTQLWCDRLTSAAAAVVDHTKRVGSKFRAMLCCILNNLLVRLCVCVCVQTGKGKGSSEGQELVLFIFYSLHTDTSGSGSSSEPEVSGTTVVWVRGEYREGLRGWWRKNKPWRHRAGRGDEGEKRGRRCCAFIKQNVLTFTPTCCCPSSGAQLWCPWGEPERLHSLCSPPLLFHFASAFGAGLWQREDVCVYSAHTWNKETLTFF